MFEDKICNRAAQALGNLHCTCGIRFRHADGKLFTAVASEDVCLAQAVLAGCGDHAQDLVTGLMPKIVIEALEKIEVNDGQRNRGGSPEATSNLPVGEGEKKAPVADAGQQVG